MSPTPHKRVMIFGTFDLFHPGHAALFDQAMSRGTVGVVVARSENVQKIKGRSPVQSLNERMAAIRARFPSVEILPGNDTDFLAPVRTWKPDLILLGYDQKLPPGVSESDFSCPIERATAFQPERYKSSLMGKDIDKKGEK